MHLLIIMTEILEGSALAGFFFFCVYQDLINEEIIVLSRKEAGKGQGWHLLKQTKGAHTKVFPLGH